MYNFADIIVLIIITVFLAIRLFAVLGKKTDDGGTEDVLDQGSSLLKKPRIKNVEVSLENVSAEQKLQLLDPSFNKSSFLNNSQEAFKMILEAYASGDNHVLSKLLNVEMMRKFTYEISKREEKNLKCEISVLKIKKTQIKSVSIDGTVATIQVELDAEVINFSYNSNGKAVSGDKSKVEKSKHVWGFSRNLRSQDPNWMLVSVDKLFS